LITRWCHLTIVHVKWRIANLLQSLIWEILRLTWQYPLALLLPHHCSLWFQVPRRNTIFFF
jgi:hypothetical protein